MHTKNAKPQNSILNSYNFTFLQDSNLNFSVWKLMPTGQEISAMVYVFMIILTLRLNV